LEITPFILNVGPSCNCLRTAVMQVIECSDGNHNIATGRKFWY